MGKILFFTGKELALVVAVGVITGLADDRVEMLEFAFVARSHIIVLVNDYLAYVTGGPIFGDLLETWLEWGAVLAACLVRRPAAGTLALTVNGVCQVFVNGTHNPHLLYGVPGLGADIVFAFFRYRRYDPVAVALAGVGCATFWYPIVWFTHGIYAYPVSFILPDLASRVVGCVVGDGLLAGVVALALVRASGRRWSDLSAPSLQLVGGDTTPWNSVGLLVASLGVLLIVLTYSVTLVRSAFAALGPKIPAGLPSLEEYNPGYVIGALVIFLVIAVLAFWNLETRSGYLRERP